MATTHTVRIDVSHAGRQAEEEWETIEVEDVAFWRTSANRLATRTYVVNGVRNTVAVDWNPLIERLELHLSALRETYSRGYNPETWEKVRAPADVLAHCTADGHAERSPAPRSIVEYYLYEVFTVVNLACPGAAEFLNLCLSAAFGDEPERLHLSAFYFSDWRIESERGRTPTAKMLPVDQVMAWYARVSPAFTQRPTNNTQKALFALYYLCRSDGSVDFILWLFNALESLLATRVGENFSGIVSRASLLLELDDAATKRLRRGLRALYDVRSAFIHGGYSAPHPMGLDFVDPKLSDDYGELVDLGRFGFNVVGALLQRMIELNASTISFRDQLIIPGALDA